jgi:hypothetical protein
VVVLLLIGAVGCTRPAGTPLSTPSTATTSPAASARLQPNGVVRRLRLAAGPAAARFAVHAPAPPSHTFTVRIVAPHHADQLGAAVDKLIAGWRVDAEPVQGPISTILPP